MNKYLIYICSLSIMLFASCNSFLDQAPITTLESGKYWKNEADANAGIVAMYYSFSRAMSNGYFDWGEIRGGNWIPNDKGGVAQQELINHIIPSTNNAGVWTNLYQAINRANLAIKYIPNMSISPVKKSTLLGEAYAMRALCYFYAIRVWGDVPLLLKSVEKWDITVAYPTRTNKSIVMESIFADLYKAEQLLPNVTTKINKCRITRAAVYAMMMDCYAWTHQYDKVISVMEEKINLLSSSNWALDAAITPTLTQEQFTEKWRNIFINAEKSPSVEVFLAIAYDYYGNGTNSSVGYLAISNSSVRKSPDLESTFSQSDKRYDGTFKNTSKSFYKFWTNETVFNGANASRADNPLVIYRYADLVLLYAEALNKDFRMEDAITQMNKIRRRSGVEIALITDYVDNDELADDILKERRCELAGEGKYWFDLVRSGNESRLGGCTNPDMVLFPIHINHILQNPNVKQNKGYN